MPAPIDLPNLGTLVRSRRSLERPREEEGAVWPEIGTYRALAESKASLAGTTVGIVHPQSAAVPVGEVIAVVKDD